MDWIFLQISFDLLLTFQLLRNDSVTQISQSSSWRQHFGSGKVHLRYIIICIKGTNKSLHRADSLFSFML